MEKDYKILKTCSITGSIYSVKRITDGEVFIIGDKIKTNNPKRKHIIRQFKIKQKCFGRNFSGEYTYDGIDRIWVDWEEFCGGHWLESINKNNIKKNKLAIEFAKYYLNLYIEDDSLIITHSPKEILKIFKSTL